MLKKRPQAGLIKLLILVILTILILSFLGVNIQKIAESEIGQANFAYVWEIIRKIGDWFVHLYQQYLAGYLNGPWSSIKNIFIK